ncbi:unnamed protein product [Trichogramma brassicae]|uniref:Uncharacterized protein n=1 Tax=Trichogramma brassicae TaxID=86971 RepID=A0A6H5ILG2_9HYME|nr:unnamed protein product [Trichogramma brassicae]
MALYGAAAWGEALKRKDMREELIRCQRVVLSACMRVCHTVPTVAMQVLAGSPPPWDLQCLMRRTGYRIRRGLALDDLDLIADDGSDVRSLLARCNEVAMDKWQEQWDSSDKGRVTYEFVPDVRISQKWSRWMNVGWLVGYILTAIPAIQAQSSRCLVRVVSLGPTAPKQCVWTCTKNAAIGCWLCSRPHSESERRAEGHVDASNAYGLVLFVRRALTGGVGCEDTDRRSSSAT